MTRSEALDIANDLPKTLEDLATQIEFRGADEVTAALEDVGIDGTDFLLALKDDLKDAAAKDFIREAVEDELSALFEEKANKTFNEIADKAA